MSEHPLNLHLTVNLGDILPDNATPLDRALADVEGHAILAAPAEIVATLWDPETCPTHLLPYLAWSVSVDWWDNEWPETIQRAVVAASPGVHRIKGTRRSVEDQLAALQVTARITEWWEVEPNARRGTFVVTAYAGQAIYDDPSLPFLSARLQRAAREACRAAKPKSRVMDFRVGVDTEGREGLIGAITIAPVLTIEAAEPGMSLGLVSSITISGVLTLKGLST